MKNDRTLNTVLPLGAALLVISMYYGLDRWWEAAKAYSSMNFEMLPFFLQAIAIHLLLAVSVIALHWFVNIKMRPDKLAAWLLVIFGGVLTFYPVLFAGSLALPFLDQLYPVTLLSQACAFITVIGVIGLLRKSPK